MFFPVVIYLILPSLVLRLFFCIFTLIKSLLSAISKRQQPTFLVSCRISEYSLLLHLFAVWTSFSNKINFIIGWNIVVWRKVLIFHLLGGVFFPRHTQKRPQNEEKLSEIPLKLPVRTFLSSSKCFPFSFFFIWLNWIFMLDWWKEWVRRRSGDSTVLLLLERQPQHFYKYLQRSLDR